MIGGIRGLLRGRPRDIELTRRLVINHHLNNYFKYSLRWSTMAATTSRLDSPGCLFCFNANILNLFFEDQLANLSDLHRNLLNGFMTGAFYSCTRGLVPTMVGGLTGTAIIFSMHQIVQYMRDHDLVNFEMKF
jgi:hypothetical protein